MSQRVQLGLLGNGIGRSRAKNLHELLGEIFVLQVNYRVMDLGGRTEAVSIADELARCRDEGFRGVNVTHPYKREAFLCVKPLPQFPAGLTSVNTVLFEAPVMHADNTDYSGFIAAFRSQFGEDCRPGRVLMLGAGGVGVAIAYGLARLGAGELVIHDTRPESAEGLVRQLAASNIPARLADPDLAGEMHQADGLINATPLGMFQYPGNAFPLAGFARQKWAFDAVYTPENTEFLRECRNRGIDTLSGFKLFLYQGLHAFLRFTGINADAAEVEPEFLKRYPLE